MIVGIMMGIFIMKPRALLGLCGIFRKMGMAIFWTATKYLMPLIPIIKSMSKFRGLSICSDCQVVCELVYDRRIQSITREWVALNHMLTDDSLCMRKARGDWDIDKDLRMMSLIHWVLELGVKDEAIRQIFAHLADGPQILECRIPFGWVHYSAVRQYYKKKASLLQNRARQLAQELPQCMSCQNDTPTILIPSVEQYQGIIAIISNRDKIRDWVLGHSAAVLIGEAG